MDERLSYLLDLQRLVGRIRVDIAARGIGKTSLLRQVQRRADERGALTVWATAGEDEGLIIALADEIDRRTSGSRSEARGHLRELLEQLTVTAGVPGVAQVQATVRPRRPAGDRVRGAREFEGVVRQTVAAARAEQHGGVVLFIDEIQAADPEGLRTLAYAWQHLQSEGHDLPAAVFAAGLPNSPEVIAAVVTFNERFAYRPLDRLDEEATLVALAGPAAELGVRWDDAALERAVHIAQGYPYSVQLIADATWAAARYPDRGSILSLDHVHGGQATMQADLDALFRARWEKATPVDHDFMAAMASLGDDPVQRADIARVLGVSSDDLSVPRSRLIDKGLVDAAGHGRLQFTIPGFGQYVRSRIDSADPPSAR
jgi:MoxR-like ATPase